MKQSEPPADDKETTHFGYQQIPLHEKERRVAGVFDSVASRYDLMNDLMSFGIHRLWKRVARELTGITAGDRVLDLAGGTGDIARLLLPRVGESGEVVVADINRSMLEVGRQRLINEGWVSGLRFVQANAEALPFPDNYFDCITIAFGLRNVTNKERALAAMLRLLKPGSPLIVLEFSQPAAPLRPLYDLYSFQVLPLLGQLVTSDAESYRYLAESIRVHPDQEGLKAMMEEAGFERVEYFNLTGGVVAIHRGFKL